MVARRASMFTSAAASRWHHVDSDEVGVRVGAHRRRRWSRLRVPALGLGVLLTIGAGSTLALARVARDPAPPATPAPRVPVFALEVPETAAGRVRETSIVAVAEPADLTVGKSTVLRATLTSVATGRPVTAQSVEVYIQHVTGPRRLFTRLVTDRAGTVLLPQRPAKHTVYDFVFPGRGGYRAAASRRVGVAVRARLGLRRNFARVPSGHVVTFRGSVAPARPGQRVYLQVQSAKGWRTVTSRPVNALGGFRIPLRQGNPGRYVYRAYTRATPLDGAVTQGIPVEVAADVAGTRATTGTRRVSAAAPLRLLVTGDSMVFYVGEEMRYDRRARPRLRTELESRHSTGLARPEYFNWYARAAAQLAATNPEAVVVWLGGNDCQPLRTPAGRWLATGSAGWQAEYTRRSTLLMRAYATGGRRVYWIGMPTARDPAIAGCFRAMTAATRRAALAVPGTTWLDTIAMFSGPEGGYVENIGHVRVRGDDGIHLTRAGSAMLSRRLLSLLQIDWRVLG